MQFLTTRGCCRSIFPNFQFEIPLAWWSSVGEAQLGTHRTRGASARARETTIQPKGRSHNGRSSNSRVRVKDLDSGKEEVYSDVAAACATLFGETSRRTEKLIWTLCANAN